MRLDMRPLGSVAAPFPLPKCPGSGFVIYKDAFSDAEIVALRSRVAQPDYATERANNTDHYMAAWLMKQMDADLFEVGQMYLQASWEAEDALPPAVQRYRTLALESLGTFLQFSAVPTVPWILHSERWWRASVLAAELERLLGRFDDCQKRLAFLPMIELFDGRFPEGTTLLRVIEQIKTHAAAGNAAPVAMVTTGTAYGQ